MLSEISFSGKKNALSLENLMAAWQLFDDRELRAFRKKLAADDDSPNQSLSLFFDYVKEALRKQGTVIRGASLAARIIPQTPAENIRSILGQLVKKLEARLQDYAVELNLQNDPSLRGRILVKTYKKGLSLQRFAKECQTFEQTLQAQPLSVMNAADQWWVNHQRYFHQAAEQYQEDVVFFDEAFDWSEKFFILTQLRYYCEYFNRIRKSLLRKDRAVPAYFSGLCQSYSKEEFPLIALYWDLLQLLQDPDNEKHKLIELKKNFAEAQPQMEKDDQLTVVKYAMNLWNYFVEKNDPEAPRNLFEWAKKGIDQRLFSFEKHISDDEFLNISLIATMAGKFKFQKKFMDEYRDKLDPAYRHKAYQLALAYYYFFQNDYQKTKNIIDETFPPGKQDAPKYNLRVKTLLIRCCVHRFLDDWDGEEDFNKASDNLKVFISRHPELPNRHREPYLLFVEFCKEILEVRKALYDPNVPDGLQRKKELQEKFRSVELLACRPWLKKVIEELD